MSLIPLIVDCEVSYGRGALRPVSVLGLPLGMGTVLEHLSERLEKVGHGEIFVLGRRSREDELPKASPSGLLPIRAATPESLAAELDRYEASDSLLIVDPRLWPAGGYDFEKIRQRLEDYRGATFFIAVDHGGEGARERLECNAEGHVRRVQRLYAKNWSEVDTSNINCAVVPLRSVIGMRFLFPAELRAGLAGLGVLGQDLPWHGEVFRLGHSAGFLGLTERSVARVCRAPAAEGFSPLEPEVLVGPGCRIAGSVRLVPPIIVQPGCAIDEDAVVIGPAVIGAGSRIMRGAVVAQSALAQGSVVLGDMIARQQVVCGKYAGEAEPQPVPGGYRFDVVLPGGRNGCDEYQPAWNVPQPEKGRKLHLAFKRAADVFLAATGMLVLLPILAMTAVLVKLDSRGPVFFGHAREGRRGREFKCWKFRTMVADADQRQRALYKQSQVDGPQFKIKDDPRVTRVGRILRSTNIDELPQLWNVLIGDMSLVGPRPSPFRENQICVPWRRARLSVRPGITGLWQVCRDEARDKGDFHEWIYYDVTYVRHLSAWLDAKILVATVLTLGGRRSVALGRLLPELGRAAAGCAARAG